MNNKDFQYQYELKQVTGGTFTSNILPPATCTGHFPYVGDRFLPGSVPVDHDPWYPNQPYYPNQPFYPKASPNAEQEAEIKRKLEEYIKHQEKKPNALTKDVMKEANKTSPGTAIKLDTNKLRWSLLPYDSLEEVVKVLEFGAIKYAPDNWKQGKGLGTLRVLNSCLRHLFSYLNGEKIDPETGLSHLAHATCNLLFALHYIKYKDTYLQDGIVEKNT